MRESIALLWSYILKVIEDPLPELSALSLFALGYLFLRLSLRRLLGEGPLKLFAELASLLGISVLLSYLQGVFPELEAFKVLTAFLYFAVGSTVSKLLPLSPSYRWVFNVILLLGALFLFFQEVSGFYHLLFKLSTALVLGMLLLGLYSYLMSYVKKDPLRKFLKRVSWSFFLLYGALASVLVFGAVSISKDFPVKVAILAGILIAYFLLQVYITSGLERYLGEDFRLLKPNLRRFGNLLSLFILYEGLDILFGLKNVRRFLGKLLLIDTELVRISLISFLESLYLFLLLLLIVKLTKDSVYLYFSKRGMELEGRSLRALVSNLGILVVILVALLSLGINWKVLVPLAGALGIGLGFGLQTILSNYVSGFLLLLSRTVKVGDIVELEGKAGQAIGKEGDTIFGEVVSINVLTTIVRTTDNFEIAIPNSQFVSGRVVNYSLSDPRVRVRIPFPVSYSSDPKKVEEILLSVASEIKEVLKDPPPTVWFYGIGENALIFQLLVWVDIRRVWRTRALRSAIYFRAWERFLEEGIEIPFPQRDVWFKNTLKVEIDEGNLPEGSHRGG